MSLDLLGDGFDIHGGGQDLAFPHHENERAQAVAEGHSFARHWVHNGWVVVEGEKMSKSLGNFTDLLDFVAVADPRAYRLLVLRSHYRAPIEVTKETVADAEQGLKRLDSFARRFADAAKAAEPDAEALATFRELMDDDLGTPAAIALLFDLVARANKDDDLAGRGRRVLDLRGGRARAARRGGRDRRGHARAVARRRDEARAAKDWGTADALRDELSAMGYVVEDGPDGTELRPRCSFVPPFARSGVNQCAYPHRLTPERSGSGLDGRRSDRMG